MVIQNIKKTIAIVVSIIALIFISSSIAEYYFSQDAGTQKAQDYLMASKDFREKFGAINNVTFKKYLKYDGVPGKEVPYRQYSFLVNGIKSQALVVVEAKENTKDISTYRIVKITQ